MADEVRSMSFDPSSAEGSITFSPGAQPFGEPLRTIAVGHELDSDTFALWRMNDADYRASDLNTAADAGASSKDLAPSTLSDWTYVPPISYGPGGNRQPCRWFRGSGASSNLTRTGETFFSSLLTGDFTIECWVYVEDLADVGNQVIFMYAGVGETEITNSLFQVETATDGKIVVTWEYGAGVDATFTTTSAYLTSKTWYHLTVSCVVATGTRTAKIYVDGSFKESTSDTNASGGTTADLQVGWSGSDRKFYGAIADMRLSDKERSAAEIAVSAAATDFKHLLDSDTASLWRFDEDPEIRDEAGSVPLNPLSFTTEPVITSPLINDNGKARLFDDDRDGWFPERDLIRDRFLADLTFEAWFRVNDKDGTSGSFSPNDMYLFAYAGDWSLETEVENILLRVSFPTSIQRKLRVGWETGAGTDVTSDTTSEILTTPEWWTRHHIAVTREVGATSTVRVYFDGVFVEEFTGLTNATGATAKDVFLSIGYANGGTDTPFVLDDVRLSSKIRTAGEVAQSFARGTPVDKIVRYSKRARDSGSSGTVYVTWETTDPNGSFQGIIPGGGPLVDEVLLDKFQV